MNSLRLCGGSATTAATLVMKRTSTKNLIARRPEPQTPVFVAPLSILGRVRGLRYLLRNYTALAVKERLRSQVDRTN
jgi:hypothetical protein